MNYGFTFKNFFAHKWFILFTANFLHFSYGHLFGNMVMLFVFCGTLEFIAGSGVAALSFLVAMNANVPTAFVLLPILKWVNFEVWQHVVSYTDVGASLGIVGCLGALLQFLKNKRKLLLLVCLMTVAATVFMKELFGIDHTFAVVIGYVLGHFYLYQRIHWRGPRRFFASPDHLIRSNSPIPFRQAR
jgi:membrane associated rhomboid family serine protease